MLTLHHHPFCPHSRFVRLLLAEYGVTPALQEVRPWERRNDFLMLNPACETPVMVVEGDLTAADDEDAGLTRPQAPIIGASVINEYLHETLGAGADAGRLLPDDVGARAEARRLVCWFNEKFFDEVSGYLVTEKIYKRFMAAELGGGPPDMNCVRAARNNVRYHARYIGFLLKQRPFLAGDKVSCADLAAAAHLSCVDYLGDAPWSEDAAAAKWYLAMKNRPSFQTLLEDMVPGMAPAASYTRLSA